MSYESPYARNPKRATTRLPPLRRKPIGKIRRWLRDIFLTIAGWIQGQPVWPYPLEAFFNVEDKEGLIYVWTLHPEQTDDEALELAEAFQSEFVQRYNRVPRAVHIFTPDVHIIRRLTAEDLEDHLLPVLQREVAA